MTKRPLLLPNYWSIGRDEEYSFIPLCVRHHHDSAEWQPQRISVLQRLGWWLIRHG